MLKFLFFQETKSWEFRFPTKSTIPRALIYKTVYKINNIKKKKREFKCKIENVGGTSHAHQHGPFMIN